MEKVTVQHKSHDSLGNGGILKAGGGAGGSMRTLPPVRAFMIPPINTTTMAWNMTANITVNMLRTMCCTTASRTVPGGWGVKIDRVMRLDKGRV